jgi:hypothetical protein
MSAVSKCKPMVGPKDGSFTLKFKSATAKGLVERVAQPESHSGVSSL